MTVRFDFLSAALLSLSLVCTSAQAQETRTPAVKVLQTAQVTPDQDASEGTDSAEENPASPESESPTSETTKTTSQPDGSTDKSTAEQKPEEPAADDATAGTDNQPKDSQQGADTNSGQPAAADTAAAPPEPATLSPLASAIKQALADTTSKSDDEQAKKEREAIAALYEKRSYAPLWVDDNGLTQNGKDIIAALQDANSYGLEASDFAVPKTEFPSTGPAALAADELMLTRSAVLYARYARGGRIMEPAEMLNSNLDRKPQLLDPNDVLAGLAAASAPAEYLVSTHPKHPQFEKLRQAFLAAGGAKAGSEAKGGKRVMSSAAKRLRANMEEWRWMHDDMGELYVFNNIPEFMQYVYKDGKVIRKERIVAGMLDKQSSIFTRNLKYVVLRPKWRVPESIMVNELWPSLLKGGGLMREYGLQLETKDGRVLDWRKIDWTKDDIRNYYVMQPPGRKSVLGVVKFSFPSQHTIFMHDTPDKWMFRQAQRTLSHGCLRVQNPVELADIILDYDKGWDKAKIAELIRSGPLNNEVAMEKRIPIHLAYFTAWVEDNGKVRAFPDIYGHERRITQALDGQWDKIKKGRNHLAPPQPNFNPKAVASSAPARQKRQPRSTGDIISDMFGLSF
ncbi:MAG: L,D-transpeptidase family protein [Hyphomicrobiaceae bacterium]|nr:L,D-transpeptidase family protein [Hyphomicrobiaceae bacterium]